MTKLGVLIFVCTRWDGKSRIAHVKHVHAAGYLCMPMCSRCTRCVRWQNRRYPPSLSNVRMYITYELLDPRMPLVRPRPCSCAARHGAP